MAVHRPVNADTGRISQRDRPCPFQVGKEGIDTSCLSHEGHAGSRPDREKRSSNPCCQRDQKPLAKVHIRIRAQDGKHNRDVVYHG